MTSITIPLTAPALLDREFLGVRARLLELAAALDRIERAAGDVGDDPRLTRIRQALEILGTEVPGTGAPDRAEQIQLLFSRAYEADWRRRFGLDAPRDA